MCVPTRSTRSARNNRLYLYVLYIRYTQYTHRPTATPERGATWGITKYKIQNCTMCNVLCDLWCISVYYIGLVLTCFGFGVWCVTVTVAVAVRRTRCRTRTYRLIYSSYYCTKRTVSVCLCSRYINIIRKSQRCKTGALDRALDTLTHCSGHMFNVTLQ